MSIASRPNRAMRRHAVNEVTPIYLARLLDPFAGGMTRRGQLPILKELKRLLC